MNIGSSWFYEKFFVWLLQRICEGWGLMEKQIHGRICVHLTSHHWCIRLVASQLYGPWADCFSYSPSLSAHLQGPEMIDEARWVNGDSNYISTHHWIFSCGFQKQQHNFRWFSDLCVAIASQVKMYIKIIFFSFFFVIMFRLANM